MRTTFDFGPLFRSSIDFDRILIEIAAAKAMPKGTTNKIEAEKQAA
ncbi:hypothetical protein [Mesorhizobium sp. B2-4-15]|nr:hypothetical protein [Mesorhizobium sp. B2-4-15]